MNATEIEVFSHMPARDMLADRICRLAYGELMLVESSVAEIISESGAPNQNRNDKLNRVVVDAKNWLKVAGSELSELSGERVSSAVSAIEQARSHIGNGEWMSEEWFHEEWACSIKLAKECLGAAVSTEHGIRISEFQIDKLTPQMRRALSEICREWVIDISRREPQEGFPYEISEHMFEEMLSPQGTITWLIEDGGSIKGLYVVYTDESPEVLAARESIQKWKETASPKGEGMFLELIAFSREFSESCDARGFAPYRELLETVDQTATLLGYSWMICEVRVGEQANKCISKHERYWERTGITRMRGEHPGELLARSVNSLLPDLESDGPIASFPARIRDLGDSPVRVLEMRSKSGLGLGDPHAACDFARRAVVMLGLSDVGIALDDGTLSGGKSAVVLSHGSSTNTLFQCRERLDEWEPLHGSRVFRGTEVDSFRNALLDGLLAICFGGEGAIRVHASLVLNAPDVELQQSGIPDLDSFRTHLAGIVESLPKK